MKRIYLLLTLLVATVWAYGQQTISSDSVSAFSSIEISGNLIAECVKGSSNSINIQLHSTDITRLDWGVKDGVLFVKLKPSVKGESTGDVKIVYSSDPETIKISESNVAFKDTIERQSISIDLSSGATLGAIVSSLDLTVKATGNSIASLSGESKYIEMSSNSKSKIDSRNLISVDAEVTASSGSEIYFTVNERLKAYSEIGSSIYYKGEPLIKRTTTRLMGGVFSLGK